MCVTWLNSRGSIMSVQVFGNALLVVTIAVLEFALILFPIAKVLRRMGLSGWWSLSRADGRRYDYWAVDIGLPPLARA
jgi:hypothetical protein